MMWELPPPPPIKIYDVGIGLYVYIAVLVFGFLLEESNWLFGLKGTPYS